MPTYKFRLRRPTGELRTGTLVGPDEESARKTLRSRTDLLVSIQRVRDPRAAEAQGFRGGRVKAEDLAAAFRQLATLQDAGLPLLKALEMVAGQTRSARLREVLRDVNQTVNRGASFAEALGRHPQTFSPTTTGLVEAGEMSGELGRILLRLAEYLERQDETKRNLYGALTYPAFLLVVCLGVVIFLVTVMIPQLTPVFEDMGAKLPWVTRALLGLSKFCQDQAYLILPAVAALVALIVAGWRNENGRLFAHQLRRRIPVLGELFTKSSLARFAETLSLLLESGIPILSALEVAGNGSSDLVLSKGIEDVDERVRQGKPLAESLARHDWMPEMLVGMVAVGEQSGRLPEVLSQVARHYEQEVDVTMKRFSRLIEPVMITVLTFIVGFVAMAVFVPLADLSTAAGQ